MSSEVVLIVEASFEGRYDKVKELVKGNARINKRDIDGWNAFHASCANNSVDIVRLLLKDALIEINATIGGSTGFYLACHGGCKEVVELLLQDERVDINLPSEDGWTPILHACWNGHVDIVKLMIASGRAINLQAKTKKFGNTIYDKATEKNQFECIDLFKAYERKDTRIIQELRQSLGMESIIFY